MLAQVPVKIGAKRRAAAIVCDRVFCAGLSAATIDRVAARLFALFCLVGVKVGIIPRYCGAYTLESG